MSNKLLCSFCGEYWPCSVSINKSAYKATETVMHTPNGKLPDRYYDIDDIKTANARAGHKFFSAGAMRFFSCRVCPTVHQGPGGVYFVTSEQYRDNYTTLPRKYTIREFNPESGWISSASEFQEYSSRKAAQGAAARLAATEKPKASADNPDSNP